MGCVCGKPTPVDDPTPPPQIRAVARPRVPVVGPRLSWGIPKAVEGEQVAAGWPFWLAAVAGEAVRGWVPRRADSFQKLDKIGQGTYSNVYRARDLENGKIVALKKVRFDNLEPESVRFMAREINILRRLDHQNIIKLEGLVTSRMSCSLYLVFEYMDHDLTGLASCPGRRFTESQVKCYMQQLLQGLDHCHSRNILHRDIKGSNLLIGNNGILKIADFGLASFFNYDQCQPLTSRVVTLWYRPPELLLGATSYGVGVDLWSSGCILAELYARKPVMPGRTEVEQLHKIFKLCGSPSEEYWKTSKLPHATIFKPQQPYRRRVVETFRDLPAPALSLIDVLLSIDPADRGTAASALKSDFFMTKPLPCNPSSLPKYPPSKEIDMKIRVEETKRLGAAGKLQQPDFERKVLREPKAIPAPDANAELASSIQRRQALYSSRSRSEKFNRIHEVASGFPIEPSRQATHQQEHEISLDRYSKSYSNCGALVPQIDRETLRKIEDDSFRISADANLSAAFSNLGTVRVKTLADDRKGSFCQAELMYPSGRLSECGNQTSGSSRKYDQLLLSHALSGSQLKEDEKVNSRGPVTGVVRQSNKIHYSGPLLRRPSSADQMIKEHDHQIRDFFRRSHVDKSKIRKVQAEANLAAGRPSELVGAPTFRSTTGAPVFPSGRGSV